MARTQNGFRVPCCLRRTRGVLMALSLCASLVNIAVAQSNTTGSISGVVRDEHDAVVPKAEVLIQEERTGLSRIVITDEEGFYSAESLSFGRYSISAARSGFKKAITSGVELHVSENVVVNLTLAAGQISETVNVYRD